MLKRIAEILKEELPDAIVRIHKDEVFDGYVLTITEPLADGRMKGLRKDFSKCELKYLRLSAEHIANDLLCAFRRIPA